MFVSLISTHFSALPMSLPFAEHHRQLVCHTSVLGVVHICLVWSNTSSPTPDPVRSDLAEDQKNVLDRDKCLEALASLRHAKWFQVRLLLHVVLNTLRRTRDIFLVVQRRVVSNDDFISPDSLLWRKNKLI